MLFNEETLKSAGHSVRAIATLKRRQRGGLSGNAGYAYQRRYALLRLAELAAASNDAIVSMEALCPVDDVVVQHPAGHEYAQCKISPTQSWLGDKKKLTAEFNAQNKLLKKATALPYRLSLVVPHRQLRDTLAAETPRSLKPVVDVLLVEQPKPEHHHWTTTRMVAALDALLPPLLRRRTEREQIYKELNHHAGEPWQHNMVSSVLSAIADATDVPLVLTGSNRRDWRVSASDWQAAHERLLLIQGLTIDVTGDVCCYRFGVESGLVARCDTPQFKRFCDDIIAKSPTTMEHFFEALPR